MSYFRNGISLIIGLMFGAVLYSILNLIPDQSVFSLIIELIILFALTGFVTTYTLPKTSSEDSQNTYARLGGVAGGIIGVWFFSEMVGPISSIWDFASLGIAFFIFVVGGLFVSIIGGTFGVMAKNRN